ncbi:hypothetical protein ABZP36_030140 [Zizania latifolia]
MGVGMAIGEALRRLYEDFRWSYAVFWKAIGAADPVCNRNFRMQQLAVLLSCTRVLRKTELVYLMSEKD